MDYFKTQPIPKMFIVSTPRLQLIPLNVTQLWLFRSDPEFALELLGIEPVLLNTTDSMGNNTEEAFDYFEAKLKEDPDNYPWHTTWHIVLKEENKRIGRLGFGGIPAGEHNISSIGYGIDEQYRNQGYMTEALQAAMYWAFQHIELNYLLAKTYQDNFPSHRVLTKCGFSILDKSDEEGNMVWAIRNGNIQETTSQNQETTIEEMAVAY